MPCRDGMEDVRRREESERRAIIEASLCAVLTVLDKDDAEFGAFLKKIDWKEAGVTKRQFLSWWEDHKEWDRKRREAVAQQVHEAKVRKDALSKLTEYEKKILGIK